MNSQTILIVDDSPILLKVLDSQLRRAGYQTMTAEDGSRAIELARREAPGLVIMDINFPPDRGRGVQEPWDGFRIVEWLRRTGMALETPLIVITSEELSQYEHRLMALGAAAVFRKPIPTKAFLNKVKECLNSSTQPA